MERVTQSRGGIKCSVGEISRTFMRTSVQEGTAHSVTRRPICWISEGSHVQTMKAEMTGQQQSTPVASTIEATAINGNKTAAQTRRAHEPSDERCSCASPLHPAASNVIATAPMPSTRCDICCLVNLLTAAPRPAQPLKSMSLMRKYANEPGLCGKPVKGEVEERAPAGAAATRCRVWVEELPTVPSARWAPPTPPRRAAPAVTARQLARGAASTASTDIRRSANNQ
eukprot:2688381-Pleurochrysis_carterae.AAC.1